MNSVTRGRNWFGALVVALVAGGVAAGSAWQPAAGPAPAQPGIEGPTVHAAAFLAGQRRGESEDGVTEEHWSPPEAGSVMGMFRWIRPDKTVAMYEMLAISQEPDGVYLRLVHFNPKLVSREDKGDPMVLRLADFGPDRAVFKAVEKEKRIAAVSYRRPGPDRLAIVVEFPDPAREPLTFELKRMVPVK